ncbi:molybdate ABC transporter substrate-binding protein, partial [Burkholderia multivorans]
TQTAITYPIAIVKDSRHTAQAQSFVDFVASPQGQAVLAKFGFKPAAGK